DAVVLGGALFVGEAVGDEPVLDESGERRQEIAGQLRVVALKAAQRDEGVAPPVGEPGIAGDDAAKIAALDDELIAGALQFGDKGITRRKGRAAVALVFAQ